MLSLLDNEQYASSLKVLLESGRAQDLMVFLESFTKERTADIQQVCGTFYQVFGDFDKLSSLEKDAEHAKEELEKLAVACAEAEKSIRSSSKLVTHKFSLMHNRDVAMQAIDACIALLDDFSSLQQMVDEKDKLSEALLLLKKIQVTYVNPLSGRVDFVRHVASQLPKIEASLTRQANSQVKAWMTLAWEACQVVGENELANATKVLTRNAEIELATRRHLRLVAERSRPISDRSSAKKGGESDSNKKENPYNVRGLAPDFEEFQLFSSKTSQKASSGKKDDANSRTEKMKVMKDLTAGFKSLAEAVFVSQQLGTMSAVSEDYYETKNLQIPKLFQNSSLNTSHQNLPSLSSSASQLPTIDAHSRERFAATLETVAGFFAIETDVAESFDELLSNEQLQDLWRVAVIKCKQIFMNEFGSANTREEFLAVLKIVLEFSATTGMHHFDSHPLLECISNSSSVRYCEIEFQEITTRLGEMHASNNWEPMEIRSSEELQKRVIDNGLPHKDVSVPQTLPFSSLVPFFFDKLKDSVDNLFALSQYFGDVERLITKHADVCFQHFISILATKPSETDPETKHKITIQKLADLTAMCDTPQFIQDYVAQRCVFGHKPDLKPSRDLYGETIGVVLDMCKESLNSSLDVALDAYTSEWSAVLSGTGKQTVIAAEMGIQLKKYITDTETLLRRLRKDHAKQLRTLYGRIPLCISNVLNKGKKVKWSIMHSFSMDVEAILQIIRPIEDNNVATQLQQIYNLVEFLLKPDENKVLAFVQSENCPLAYKSNTVFASLIDRVKSDSHSPSDFSSNKKACIKVLSRK